MNMTPDEMKTLAQIQAMIYRFRKSAGYEATEQLAMYMEDTAAQYFEELEVWEQED